MKLRKTVDKDTQTLILEEIKRISAANPKIYLGALWLATYINLRLGELLGILEEDIDREQGIIRIRNHKTESTNEAKYVTLIEEDLELVKGLARGFPKMPFFRLDKGNGGGQAGKGVWKGVAL